MNKILPILVLALAATTASSEDKFYYGLSLGQLEYTIEETDISADMTVLEGTLGFNVNSNISLEGSLGFGIRADEQVSSFSLGTETQQTELENSMQVMINIHANPALNARPFFKLGYTKQRVKITDILVGQSAALSFSDIESFSGDGVMASLGFDFKLSEASSLSFGVDYAPSLDFDGTDVDSRALKLAFNFRL